MTFLELTVKAKVTSRVFQLTSRESYFSPLLPLLCSVKTVPTLSVSRPRVFPTSVLSTGRVEVVFHKEGLRFCGRVPTRRFVGSNSHGVVGRGKFGLREEEEI